MSVVQKVAIIGCGKIAKLHAKVLSQHDCIALYFCSNKMEDAERYNSLFSGKGVFRTYGDVLSADIDAVLICTPPQFHKDQVISALKNQKAVLVEKPLCLTLNELEEIQQQMNVSSHPFLMVAENYNYKPCYRKIISDINKGEIGELLEIKIKSKFKCDPRDWRQDYGILIEGGIHLISFIMNMIPFEEPLTIESILSDFNQFHSERSVYLKIKYPNNIAFEFDYSRVHPSLALPHGLLQHSKIIGSKGVIIFETNGIYSILKSNGLKFKFFLSKPTTLYGFAEMHNDFISSLSQHTMPYSNFDRAANVIKLISTIYKHSSRKLME